MHIDGKRTGERLAPLDQSVLIGAGEGAISIKDGLGREYVRAPSAAALPFTVGGALGTHTVSVLDQAGNVLDSLAFPVAAETGIRDSGGAFSELLQMLYYTMISDGEMGSIRYNGRIYQFFVRWLRDHVHTMKGMKYFSGNLKDGIDLYRDSQRADGMIWDNVYPRTPEPNGWDMRFSYDNFIRPFDDYSAEFKRIPAENDVEYLFIEGLYYTWKAVGDDGWMCHTLDSAIWAMDYTISSPYRWSKKYQLLKRGYTIDTWDFQAQDDCVLNGDSMLIDKDRTRFGVMFGDNTGYIAACRYLAEMLEHVGRTDDAERFRTRGREMRARLDKVSWNGRHFTHHVPEETGLVRDLGVDESTQVSLSNAYSLNRGIAHEQCAAIIKTYLGIKDALPPGSPGEWYTIYPPFERGFGNHNRIWQYMNGGVTPIVAGELAHGAFEHGFEAYGADILTRLAGLGRAHGGKFHCVYTGSLSKPPERTFTQVDIRTWSNVDSSGTGADGVPGWTGEGVNDLHEMPAGHMTLAGLPFHVPDPADNGRRACVGLRRMPGYAEQADVPVNAAAACIYFLHTASKLGAGGVAGTITLHYADGGTFSQYVVSGRNIAGWWMPNVSSDNGGHPVMEVAWRGTNEICPNVGVVAYGMDNPHPDRKIDHITLKAADDGAFWAVFGITLCDKPVAFAQSEISFGIPDNWGAAAVVYALIEGLAGVVDKGTAYNQAALAPRWLVAGVDTADATVVYPASNGYVAYRYRHDIKAKRIEIEFTGSGDTCGFHVLIPAEAMEVVSVMLGEARVTFEMVLVEQSRYVDFTVESVVPDVVTIMYRV